jgi:hypothetical protein
MTRVTLVVPDPPPTRTHAGRSADRNSPNANPLAQAGIALVASAPASFPLTFAGMTVVFGRTIPDVDPLAYHPEDVIIEVLIDVGALVDPEAWWARTSQEESADFYVVTFQTEPDA